MHLLIRSFALTHLSSFSPTISNHKNDKLYIVPHQRIKHTHYDLLLHTTHTQVVIDTIGLNTYRPIHTFPLVVHLS